MCVCLCLYACVCSKSKLMFVALNPNIYPSCEGGNDICSDVVHQ